MSIYGIKNNLSIHEFHHMPEAAKFDGSKI